MSSVFQTLATVVIVAIAAIWLVARAVAKRKHPGCGSDCGAVSPEVRRLQAQLKAKPPR